MSKKSSTPKKKKKLTDPCKPQKVPNGQPINNKYKKVDRKSPFHCQKKRHNHDLVCILLCKLCRTSCTCQNKGKHVDFQPFLKKSDHPPLGWLPLSSNPLNVKCGGIEAVSLVRSIKVYTSITLLEGTKWQWNSGFFTQKLIYMK